MLPQAGSRAWHANDKDWPDAVINRIRQRCIRNQPGYIGCHQPIHVTGEFLVIIMAGLELVCLLNERKCRLVVPLPIQNLTQGKHDRAPVLRIQTLSCQDPLHQSNGFVALIETVAQSGEDIDSACGHIFFIKKREYLFVGFAIVAEALQ